MIISEEVAKVIKSYVYLYIDPTSREVFYVGKGKGDRLFAHLEDRSETDKTKRISDIRNLGKEPQIDLLRYGLSDSEAALIEAVAIDLLGKTNLTNRLSGCHEHGFARIASQEIIAALKAKRVRVRHKAILITINKLYRSDMSGLELYEATRGIWVVGNRRNTVHYAFAVFQGIVREV